MSLDFTSLTILNTGVGDEKNESEEKSSPIRHSLHLLKNQVLVYFVTKYFVTCQLEKMLGIECF